MVMEIVIALISLAGSILSIILFFKVWRMCDDVKRIADAVAPHNDRETDVHTDTLPMDNSPIGIGSTVYSCADGRKMLVERSSGGMYYCVDPVTKAYISTYRRQELTTRE